MTESDATPDSEQPQDQPQPGNRAARRARAKNGGDNSAVPGRSPHGYQQFQAKDQNRNWTSRQGPRKTGGR